MKRILSILFLTVTGTFCFGDPYSVPHARRGNTRLYYFSGSPRKIGREQGRLFSEEIRFLLKNYLDKFLGDKKDSLLKNSILFTAKKLAIPGRFKEEMMGIAEGSGLSYDDVLIANTAFDLKKILQCTTVAAKVKNGFFARNLDFPSLGVLHKHTIVVSLPAPGGGRIVNVTFPGFVGVLSGMNSSGLACGVMEVYGKGYNVNHMPYAMAFRLLLERCKSLKDAQEFLKQIKTTTGNNLMVCDKKGNAGVFEITPSKVFLRKNTEKYIYATNHFLSERPSGRRISYIKKLLKTYKPLNKIKKHAAPGFDLDKHTVPGFDLDKDAAPGFYLDKDAAPGFDLAAKLLKKTAVVGDNIQAIIFYPGKRTMYLSSGKLPAAAGPYVPLGAPLLGLGVEENMGRHEKKAILAGDTGGLKSALKMHLNMDDNDIFEIPEKSFPHDRSLKVFLDSIRPGDLLFVAAEILTGFTANSNHTSGIKNHDGSHTSGIEAVLRKILRKTSCLKIIAIEQKTNIFSHDSLKELSDSFLLHTVFSSKSWNLFPLLSKALENPSLPDLNKDKNISLYEILTFAKDRLKTGEVFFSGKEVLKTVVVKKINLHSAPVKSHDIFSPFRGRAKIHNPAPKSITRNLQYF